MGLAGRINSGWTLTVRSFRILLTHPTLIIFPLFSSLALLLIIGSFVGSAFAGGEAVFDRLEQMDDVTRYSLLFLFYLITSAVVIFFNVAMLHCTFKIFEGGEANVGDGMRFAASRLPVVLSWALVSATIDVVIKIVEDKSEPIAKIITGIFGMLWALATFFVLPVMVYENLGVVAAVKRSSALFKSTWGERAGAHFSFGIIGFLIFVPVFILLAFLVAAAGSSGSGIVTFLIVGILIVAVVCCIMSAARTVFLAEMYRYAVHAEGAAMDPSLADNLFKLKS